MKKTLGILLAAAFVLTAAVSASAQLRSGEAAIFLKSGDLVVDKIIDISSTRLVLETANNGEFPLRDLWMINYINQNWDFPNERNQIETNEHYFFLRNGNIVAGKIVDFSSGQIVWELEDGNKIAPGSIRRIYFSKNVSAALKGQQQDVQNQGLQQQIAGTYRTMSTGCRISLFELVLEADRSATLILGAGDTRQSYSGNWGFYHGDEGVLAVKIQNMDIMTFGRNANMMVGLSYDKARFGTLRLRKID